MEGDEVVSPVGRDKPLSLPPTNNYLVQHFSDSGKGPSRNGRPPHFVLLRDIRGRRTHSVFSDPVFHRVSGAVASPDFCFDLLIGFLTSLLGCPFTPRATETYKLNGSPVSPETARHNASLSAPRKVLPPPVLFVTRSQPHHNTGKLR